MNSDLADPKGKLPPGWMWAKLGDVCVLDRVAVPQYGPTLKALAYVGGENIESNTGRILLDSNGTPDQSKGRSTTFKFDPRHILYSKLRPYLNKVALPDFAGRCSTELIPLLPTRVDRNYLALFLRLPETADFAMQASTGSRMPRTDMTAFLELPIPLPPLVEQKRIVSKLNEQLAAIERAKQAAAQRLEAAQGLWEASLRQSFRHLAEENHGGYPRAKLSDVCTIVTGNTPTKSNSRFYGGCVPWVNPSYLGVSKYVRNSEEHLTSEGLLTARLVPRGTVMVTCISGSRSNIGKVAIAERQLTTNQQINSVVPGPNIDSEFLYYHFLAIKPELEALAASTNQNIKLEAVGMVERSAAHCLESLSSLPSILLRRAFSGEV